MNSDIGGFGGAIVMTVLGLFATVTMIVDLGS
jgi:hypothetical protein